jgi:hypothetical protein
VNLSRATPQDRRQFLARVIGGKSTALRTAPDDGDEAALATAYGQRERDYYNQLLDETAEPERIGR